MIFANRLTPRRVASTVAFVFCMFVLIVVAGQFWITHSVPYELGRSAVGLRLAVAPEAILLKRMASFRFNEGEFSGEAVFALCAPEAKCFTVVAKKEDASWSVVQLVER